MANNILLKIISCVCIFCLPLYLPAQDQKKIDSLKQVIAHTQNDTTKLKALVLLNKSLQDRKELTEGYQQQIQLSVQLHEYDAACEGYIRLAYFEFENNNFDAAEKLNTKAFVLASKTNNHTAMGRCFARTMLICDKEGDLKGAIDNLQKAEQLMLKTSNPVRLTRLYCNASEVYKNHDMLSKSLEYARKAYAIAKASGEEEPVTTASHYLASRLQLKGQYDSAIYYFSQGLTIAQKIGLIYTQGDMLNGLSGVYAEIKQYQTAREYLKKAIAKYDSVKVEDRKINCEEALAYLDFMNKDFDKVKNYMKIRSNRPTEDSLENNRYVNKWLANLALVDNDIEGWKNYSQRYEQADAAFTNNKIQKNILELEAKYEFSKKESELLQKETENRKRLWIIAALVLGLLSITIIAITQYRNIKSKQQIAIQKSVIEKQNALAEERLRIAADMHDDVGAGLSRIRYITSSLQANHSISDENINRIVSLSDESVEKMNEIIWALNQGNQQLAELIYYTRSQCSEMVSNAGIAFTFDVPDNIPVITLGWKDCRNIYLLVKEAVNNAVKHAQANSITIKGHITEQQLLFSITDNGKGFNPDEIKKNGNGLLNYKSRIEKLNGTYQLTTALAEGTKLFFFIPLNPVQQT